MRLINLITATAFSVAAYSVAQAAPESIEAAKHQANADYDAATKEAKADYRAAKEKCKVLNSAERDVCLKEAEADYTAAVEDAKQAQKTAQARAEGDERKMQAQYDLAKEKCEALSGDARSACIDRAKAQYKH